MQTSTLHSMAEQEKTQDSQVESDFYQSNVLFRDHFSFGEVAFDDSWVTETDKLVIRPLTMDNHANVTAIVAADYSKQMSGDDFIDSRYVRDMCSCQTTEKPSFVNGWLCFGIYNKSDPKTVIGCIQLANHRGAEESYCMFKKVITNLTYEEYNHGISIGYNIAKDYWGKGVMTEAAKGIVGFVKKVFPTIKAIYATAIPSNIGSHRVLEKTGFKFLGADDKAVHKDKLYKLNLVD